MIVSVYISNESIHMITGVKSRSSINVGQAIDEKINDGCIINGVITDTASLKSTLENIYTKCSNIPKNIWLTIDGSSIITKIIEVPLLKEDKLIPFLNENFQDIENSQNMIIDYMVLEQKNQAGGATVLAVLIEKDFITQYIELFSSAQIKIESIDISLGCLIRYVSSIKSLTDKTFILSVFDKNTTMLVLFTSGKYRFSKRVRIVAENDSDEMFEELVKILMNMIQFNKSEKSNKDITDIYFGGFLPQENSIYSRLSENLGVNVSVVPESSEIKTKIDVKLSNFIYASGNLIV